MAGGHGDIRGARVTQHYLTPPVYEVFIISLAFAEAALWERAEHPLKSRNELAV